MYSIIVLYYYTAFLAELIFNAYLIQILTYIFEYFNNFQYITF